MREKTKTVIIFMFTLILYLCIALCIHISLFYIRLYCVRSYGNLKLVRLLAEVVELEGKALELSKIMLSIKTIKELEEFDDKYDYIYETVRKNLLRCEELNAVGKQNPEGWVEYRSGSF